MSEDRIQSLWSALERARGTDPLRDLLSVVRALEKEGISLEASDLELIRLSKRIDGTEFLFPYQLAKFIARVLKPFSPRTILDPWAGAGILASVVYRELKPFRLTLYNRSQQATEVLEKILYGDGIDIQVGDPISFMQLATQTYDVVTSCPPFGVRPLSRMHISLEGKQRTARDEPGHLALLCSCLSLSEKGISVFVVAPSFMLGRRRAGARQVLGEIGFRIRACIEVPAGSFIPLTSIPMNIVIVERGEQGSIFVGQYSADPQHSDLLISNLVAMKEGSRLAQGKLVAAEEFTGYAALAALERARDLGYRTGLREVPFGSVVIEVNSPKPGHDYVPLMHKENSVYLPLMGTTRATTSKDELSKRLKSYAQIVFDVRKADASYAAAFLNTPLGFAVRDVVRSGVTIPRIRKDSLLDAPIFLPPLDIQRRVAAAHKDINSLRNSIENALAELESSLWNRPLMIKKHEAEISKMKQAARFEDWMESLPFHLASSLWRYHAYKGSPKEAYERLALFFEGVCQFLAVIHLSAFSSNQAIWSEIQEDLKGRLDSQSLSLDRATFGAWKLCVEYLSSKASKILQDSPEVCMELYQTQDAVAIQAISSKHIRRILQFANEIRNSAIGHVGAVSDRAAEQIHSDLRDQLDSLRDAMGMVWSRYEMILPKESKYRDGLFHYDAFRTMGTRSQPFESISLCLIEALEDDRLHMWSPGNDRTLPLLPLIKVMASPATSQNAAYFYNRREGELVRFLSYHFETESEIVEAFEDTSRTLDSLFSNTGGRG